MGGFMSGGNRRPLSSARNIVIPAKAGIHELSGSENAVKLRFCSGHRVTLDSRLRGNDECEGGHRGTRGFTLIEMIVALAVFSLAALALVKLDSSTIRASGKVEEHLLARITLGNLAVEALTDPGAPALGRSRGEVVNAGKRWFWTRQVTRGEVSAGLVRIDLSLSNGSGQALVSQTLVKAVQ
jgi:general secretion pathway protein I